MPSPADTSDQVNSLQVSLLEEQLIGRWRVAQPRPSVLKGGDPLKAAGTGYESTRSGGTNDDLEEREINPQKRV